MSDVDIRLIELTGQIVSTDDPTSSPTQLRTESSPSPTEDPTASPTELPTLDENKSVRTMGDEIGHEATTTDHYGKKRRRHHNRKEGFWTYLHMSETKFGGAGYRTARQHGHHNEGNVKHVEQQTLENSHTKHDGIHDVKKRSLQADEPSNQPTFAPTGTEDDGCDGGVSLEVQMIIDISYRVSSSEDGNDPPALEEVLAMPFEERRYREIYLVEFLQEGDAFDYFTDVVCTSKMMFGDDETMDPTLDPTMGPSRKILFSAYHFCMHSFYLPVAFF